MDRLTSMAVFVRVAERGGFAAAAEISGVSATMVGNHIRALERHLGVRLINRTTRRQSLTEAGHSYYEECREILDRIAIAETSLREMRSEARGRLRISAPVSFGAQILVPALSAYLDAHPAVEVEVALSDRMVDLAGEGFDAAIRIGVLPDSGLIARPLAPAPRVICASPAYLAQNGEPRNPEELAAHNCLAFFYPTGKQVRDWSIPQPGGDPATVKVSGRLTIDSRQALRMAALAGIGIVMQPLLLLADDIAAGRLKRLLPDYPMPNWPVQIVYLPDRQMTPKLASFIAFAQEKFG